MKIKTLSTFVSILLVSTLFIHCAAFNKKNTPLIAAVEKNLVPKKQPARILAAPLYLPVGIVAGVTDIFIVHPIKQLPDAYKDVTESLWKINFNGHITEMGTLPIRTVLSPIVFSVAWLMRSAFDFDFSHPVQEPEPNLSLEKAYSEKDTAKMSEWMGQCKFKNNEERQIARKIFQEYKNIEHQELYNNTVHCLCYYNFKDNEDFFVSQIEKDFDNSLLYCYSNHQSDKVSKEILRILQSKELTNEQFVDFINTIFRIGNQEDIQKLKEKVKR
jgi:hypothetical protein